MLLDAIRQAERREAYREALQLQAELVDLLPADDQRWLEVLDAMYARAEWLIDHRAETDAPVAVRALRAIDGLLEGSSDHARRAIVKFRLANFLAWGMGDLEPALKACQQAHELFARCGDQRQTLLVAREVGWIKGLRGDLDGMAADTRAVVEAADAIGDRFVAMQGLSAISFSANFRGDLSEGEAVLRRAAAIAREDDKEYRLTVVLGGLAAGLAFQGRVAETPPLFEEAKSANPAYRDSILVELETLVRWMAGDFRAAVALAREAVAWLPAASTRRRVPGMAFGALSALESGDVVEAERLSDTRASWARRAGLGLLPSGPAVGRRRSCLARGGRGRVRVHPEARGRRTARQAGTDVRGVRAVRSRRGGRGGGRRGDGRRGRRRLERAGSLHRGPGLPGTGRGGVGMGGSGRRRHRASGVRRRARDRAAVGRRLDRARRSLPLRARSVAVRRRACGGRAPPSSGPRRYSRSAGARGGGTGASRRCAASGRPGAARRRRRLVPGR